jgi:predicted amidohydrolase YtcJ
MDAVLYCADRVVTMASDDGEVDAFVVADGRVRDVGTAAELRTAWAGRAVEERLRGVVTPGLIDAHLHMQRAGLKALDYLRPEDDVDRFIVEMRESFDDDGPEHPPFVDRIRALERVQPLLHALGITTVVDPAVTPDELRGYQAVKQSGLLTMRTVAMPYLELTRGDAAEIDDVIARLAGIGAATGFGDDLLSLGGIKVYLDGEALKGQAWLEDPWDASGYTGLRRIPETEYRRLVAWCAAQGWGVGTHAVGSAAVALAVDAAATAGTPVADLRFQIIHGYLETPAPAMAQAAGAGVIASLQPSIIWHNGAGLRAALGDRAERANPVRSWLDHGVTVAFGSDGPFFAFDPRHLMWQAVTRRIAGDDRPLDATEAITLSEAFAAYTTGAARAAYAEGDRGVIAPGSCADWVLWPVDPTEVAIDDLRTLPVLRTEVAGRTVYRKDPA